MKKLMILLRRGVDWCNDTSKYTIRILANLTLLKIISLNMVLLPLGIWDFMGLGNFVWVILIALNGPFFRAFQKFREDKAKQWFEKNYNE